MRLRQADVVTVPCRDGGYAIVGLRQPTTRVFAGIPWSTDAVVSATRERCTELELSYQETEPWDDIDELEDLKRLLERSPQSTTAQHVISELSGLVGVED